MQKLKRIGLFKRIESRIGDLLKPLTQITVRLSPSRGLLLTIALIVLSLMTFLLLSGCAVAAKPRLPAQLDPRPMPQFKGKTTRDALMHIPELRQWGASCEADKEAVRKVYGDE